MPHGRSSLKLFQSIATLTLICAAFGAFAASAGAVAAVDALGVHADVTIDTAVVDEQTRFINARLTFVTGSKAFSSKLDVSSPRYERFLAGKPWYEGATMRTSESLDIVGPFEISGSGGGGGVGLSCSDSGNEDAHGVSSERRSWIFKIPARKTVVLTFRFEIIGDAPWLNTSYSPIIRLTPPLKRRHNPVFDDGWDNYKIPKGAVTFRKPVTLRPPSPLVRQPLGARVDLSVASKLKWHSYSGAYGTLPTGKAVRLRGRIVPPLAGQPINLSYARLYDIDHGQALAQVFTDAEGNFVYDGWIPKSSGEFAVNAAYPGQADSGLEADSGCPLPLIVRNK